MKAFIGVICLVLIAIFLAACTSSTSQDTSEMINPGDTVGDFLITTGEPEEVTFFWELNDSPGEEANTYIADVPWGTKLVVPMGIYGSDRDEKWANLKYELYIENRPVDLSAFGTIESKHEIVGTMLHYNVVIVANKPGKITIHDKFELLDEKGEDTTIYTFLPP